MLFIIFFTCIAIGSLGMFVVTGLQPDAPPIGPALFLMLALIAGCSSAVAVYDALSDKDRK